MKHLSNMHRTYRVVLFVAAVLLLGTQACENNEISNDTTDGAVPRLIVNGGVSALTLDKAAVDTLLTLDCNAMWEIASTQTWCTVTPSAGRVSIGNMKVKVSIAANTTIETRLADINFIAGDLHFTLSVTQFGIAPTLYVSGNGATPYDGETKESQLAAAGTTVSYTVSSNQPWEAAVVDAGNGTDWVTITGGSPSTATATTLTADVSANASLTAARNAYIVITGSKTVDTIKIVQAKDVPRLTATPDVTEVLADGGGVNVTVASNVAWTHSIAGGSSWFTINGTPGTLTRFTAASNTGAERAATVTFTATAYPSLTAQVTVTQLAANVSIIPPTVSTINDTSARVEITGTHLDEVTAVDFGGTPVAAANFKKQTATALWVFAPASITAGTPVTVKLLYTGGEVVAKTGFVVTDFYKFTINPTGRTAGGTNLGSPVISFTKEPYIFSICDAETDKLNMDVLLAAKTSNTIMTLFSLSGSTGTTNSFVCTTTTNTIGGWTSTDKTLLSFRTTDFPAAEYNSLVNITGSANGNFGTATNNELVIRDDGTSINLTGIARSIVTRFGTSAQRRVIVKFISLTFGANAADGNALLYVKVQRLATD
jgi:hypothetical protein